MDLVVGVDSYVSIQEATEIIAAYYLPTDDKRKAWEDLDQASQEIFLRRATLAMEGLSYRDIKRSVAQTLSFPRCYDPNAYLPPVGDAVTDDIYRDPDADKVPAAVLMAQVEEALELASPTQDTETREILGGAVRSYSIGHMSETFRAAASGSLDTVIASRRAQELLAPFVGGGYELR